MQLRILKTIYNIYQTFLKIIKSWYLIINDSKILLNNEYSQYRNLFLVSRIPLYLNIPLISQHLSSRLFKINAYFCNKSNLFNISD